ncbi:hypothetical protein HG530_000355 [Fusarium avenaceum]|nr:hypothetical protein HG530_000355 [Fusarium avenaceum]
MEDRQSPDGDEDHGSVKDEECCLVLHEAATPSHLHFGDTVEITKILVFFLISSSHSSSILDSLVSPPDVDKHQTATEDHVGHLEDDTSNEETRAHIEQALIRIISISSDGRDTTASSLDNNGEEIGANKNPGIQDRLDETVFATVPQDKVLECDGNRGGHECRAEDEKDELDDKCVVDPGVGTHDYAPAVSYQLEQCANC